MGIDVAEEVAALKRLRDKYAEVFGEATTTGNKTWLVPRIAGRLKALAEGTLSDSAMTRYPASVRHAALPKRAR
jgi:hypothetical protein